MATDDYAYGTSTTGEFAIGQSALGNIEVLGDQDSFRVRLRRGHEYRFEIVGSDYNGDSNPFNSWFSLPKGSLQLLDAGGGALASSDSGGLIFRPQTDGDYYLTARGRGVFFDGEAYSDIGTYAVSARETTDDAPEGLGSPTQVYSSSAGTLESSGDRDSFGLGWLYTDQSYVIEVRGAAAQGGLQKPALQVFNAAGTLLASDDNAAGGSSAQVTFRPTGVGGIAKDYYVTVGGLESATGTYAVGIRYATDDYVAGPATAGVLAVGGSTAGKIEWDYDEDAFRANLQAGHTYEFRLSGRWDGGGTLQEGSLWLIDAAGNWLGNTTVPDEVLTVRANADGPYYLGARGQTFLVGGDGEEIYFSSGTYVVRATDTGETFPFSTFSFDRSSLQVKESDGTATLTVKLDKPLQSAAAISYTAYSGTATVFDDFDRKSERLTFAAGQTSKTISIPIFNDTLVEGNESFTVALSNASGANLTSTTATVTLTDDDAADDFLANTSTTGTIAMGGFTTGNVEFAGDQDWFRVDLTAGRDYRFTELGLPTKNGTLPDPYLRLYDASGKLLADNDNGTNANSRIDFTAKASGAYYVAAGGYGSNIGTYRVTAADTTKPTDGRTLSISDAPAVLESGKEAVFTVTMSAASTSNVTVKYSTYFGTASSAAGDYTAAVDKTLTIPAGSLSADVKTPIKDDTFVEGTENFEVRLSSSVGAEILDGVGVATILDNDAAPVVDDFAATTATKGILKVGSSLGGNIETIGDKDWFKLTLAAAKTYQFDLEGAETSKGNLENPLLALYGSTGNLIDSNDDFSGSANSQLKFTVPGGQGGNYYLEASGVSGGTGTYSIRASDGAVGANPNNLPVVSISNAASAYEVNVLGQVSAALFNVSLNRASNTEVSFKYSTSGLGSKDITPASKHTRTFAPGQTSLTIPIGIVDDFEKEVEETFQVSLSDPIGAVLASPELAFQYQYVGNGTIKDNDIAPPAFDINKFGAPIGPNLYPDGFYSEMALLAVRAYDDPYDPSNPQGAILDQTTATSLAALNYGESNEWKRWAPLNATAMGQAPLGQPQFTKTETIGAPFIDERGIYGYFNAQAFVGEAKVNGVDTVVIAFAGTNSLLDGIEDVVRIRNHYNQMRPLIDAVDGYVQAKYVQARKDVQVFVTGHSLGGCMTEMFMNDHPDPELGQTGPIYRAATFGSPGAPVGEGAFEHDERIVEFQNSADPVTKDPLLFVPGIVVSLDLTNKFEEMADDVSAFLMPAEHQMVLYASEVRRLAQVQIPFARVGTVPDNMTEQEIIIGAPGVSDTLDGATGFDSGRPYQYLVGGLQNDLLKGGSRTDYMYGGLGDDTYEVNNIEDAVVEHAGQGKDRVIVGVNNYTLPDNVENLSLKDDILWINELPPDENLTATGNAVRNEIIGNGGDNVLRGLGGNDDIYGKDNVDVLIGGIGTDKLFGDADNDVLYGGPDSDTLTGGPETLAQRDAFYYFDPNDGGDPVLGDSITGFGPFPALVVDLPGTSFDVRNPVRDEIQVYSPNFGNITGNPETGQLMPENFAFGPIASDENDYFVFNKDLTANKGILYYDSDGSGPNAQIALAQISFSSKGDVLYNTDIVLTANSLA